MRGFMLLTAYNTLRETIGLRAMRARVLLADDHVMLRQAFKEKLEKEGFQVIAEASDGREAVQLAHRFQPDVAVLDVAMPLLNGIDAAREITKESPRTHVLLVTMHDDDAIVLRAFRAGVKGYVLKTRTMSELVVAVGEVAKGNTYLSPGASDRVVEAFLRGTEASFDPLTLREREILQLLAEGKTTKDTATILNISINTVESHRKNIMQKLDIHDTAGLVRYALRQGLIES
jgi:DNA-binding NarL/FixJ family response regulator